MEKDFSKTPFVTIRAGKCHINSEKNNAKATLYEYNNPKTGQKGSKYVISSDTWTGNLESLAITEPPFGGLQLNVKLNNGVIAIGSGKRDFSATIAKLASLDFSEPLTVTFKPYDFTTEEGERKTGLNIYQGETKLVDFYATYNKEEKKWELRRGYPVPGAIKFKEDWKDYFNSVSKYLRSEVPGIDEKIQAHSGSIAPSIAPSIAQESTLGNAVYKPKVEEDEEFDMSQVPF